VVQICTHLTLPRRLGLDTYGIQILSLPAEPSAHFDSSSLATNLHKVAKRTYEKLGKVTLAQILQNAPKD